MGEPTISLRELREAAKSLSALADAISGPYAFRLQLLALVEAVEALPVLLDAVERIRGGDASFTPEAWYAVRDHARVQVARFSFTEEGT